MVTPSGLADRESNQSPPHSASSVTVVSPVHRAAYTMSGGSKSICAPTRWRMPLNAASQNTARKAAPKTNAVFSQFTGTSPTPLPARSGSQPTLPALPCAGRNPIGLPKIPPERPHPKQTLCSASSRELHPHLFQRVQVRSQPYPRFRAQAVIHHFHIDDLPDRNAGRENTALAARYNVLRRLKICIPGKIAQFDEFSVQRPGRSDNAGVASFILDPRGDFAVRVAQQNHLRTRETDG